MKTSAKVKYATPLIFSCIIFFGQIFHSVVIQGNYYKSLLPLFISYSLIVGFIGYFIIDFITATGHLKRKIKYVKLLVLYFIFLAVINHYLLLYYDLNLKIQLISTMVILMVITMVDKYYKPEQVFDFYPGIRQMPQKYLSPHVLRTILETLFRLFPLPEPVALYKVGDPDAKSPVIVTGNYELTVRRVAKALHGIDCWLLICDSRGINVWCSSLSGHFSEKNIIQAIELTHLSKYVSHKRIILPQLCAPGIDIQDIKQKTGFTSVFGPAHIEHIKDFLNESRDESEINMVKFDIWQRVEMAMGSPIILTTILTLIYLFIDISKLLFILPGVYFFIVIHAVIYPHRPFKRLLLWSFLYSFSITVMIAGLVIFSQSFNFGWSIGIAITIGVGIFYLVNEFEGWSPLVKYNLESIYRGINIPEIRVNEERCIGCRLCFQVCPKGVFTIDNGKARVIDRKECSGCSACYKRCPTGAIIHSSDKREKEKCACVYCRMQDSLKE